MWLNRYLSYPVHVGKRQVTEGNDSQRNAAGRSNKVRAENFSLVKQQ